MVHGVGADPSLYALPSSGQDDTTKGTIDDGALSTSEGLLRSPEVLTASSTAGMQEPQDPCLEGSTSSPVAKEGRTRNEQLSTVSKNWQRRRGGGKLGGEIRAAAIAAVLAPALMVHFVVLILPLRIAHFATVDNRADTEALRYKSVEGEDSGAKKDDAAFVTSAGREPPGAGNVEVDQRSRSPRLASASDASLEESINHQNPQHPSSLGSNARRLSTSMAGVDAVASMAVSNTGEMILSAGGMDGGVAGVPAAIRRNLGRPELGIRR